MRIDEIHRVIRIPQSAGTAAQSDALSRYARTEPGGVSGYRKGQFCCREIHAPGKKVAMTWICSQTNSALENLVPTLVGGLLAVAGGFIATAWAGYQKKNALQRAIASEIRAIIALLRPAGENTRRRIVEMKTDPQKVGYPIVDFRNTYSTVFSGNAENLGLLNAELAGEIVAFYYKFQGFIEALGILSQRKVPIIQDETWRADVIARNERTITDCDEVIKSGADLVNQLEKVAQSSGNFPS